MDVPVDPADFASALENGLWFESLPITEADLQRTAQYQEESDRRVAKRVAPSLESYLESLEMSASIAPIDEPDMQRTIQLVGKTNQFNLTTRRHSEETVRRILSAERSLGLILRLADRFGDYGLVSVVIGVPMDDDLNALRVDTWLMSCRAIGRTVEDFMMNAVVERASALGYERIIGAFIPTAKNGQVSNFYTQRSFCPVEAASEPLQHFELDVSAYRQCSTAVSAATD